jgi:Acetyltransferase (GNAT) domain
LFMRDEIDALSTPIFEQAWWLDAATGHTWDQAEVMWDNKPVGWMPYFVVKRLGLKYIRMPPYTRTLTPRFNLPPAKPVRHLDNQVRVLSELLSRLPHHDRFEMTLSPNSEAIFPFVQLHYTAAANYTFCTPPNSDAGTLWSGLDQKTRNVIKTSRKKFTAEFHKDFDRFIKLARVQHKLNSKTDFNDYPALTRLWEACHSRGQSIVLSVLDDKNCDVASSLLVWDNASLYFLASARDPHLSGNSANSLQIWEALSYSRERGLSFDMDGYQSSNAASFLRTFGLSPVIRPVINKTNPLLKAILMTKTFFFPREDIHYRFADL